MPGRAYDSPLPGADGASDGLERLRRGEEEPCLWSCDRRDALAIRGVAEAVGARLRLTDTGQAPRRHTAKGRSRRSHLESLPGARWSPGLPSIQSGSREVKPYARRPQRSVAIGGKYLVVVATVRVETRERTLIVGGRSRPPVPPTAGGRLQPRASRTRSWPGLGGLKIMAEALGRRPAGGHRSVDSRARPGRATRTPSRWRAEHADFSLLSAPDGEEAGAAERDAATLDEF